jgi:AcrR family transcriptional regulator
MANKCQVCVHEQAKQIDEALVNGASIREIVERFGVSRGSVYRHRKEHLPKAIVKAKEFEDIAKADDLLAQIKEIQARTLAILERQEGKDDRLALMAIREVRGNLELLGRVIGELDNVPKVAVLVNSPDWQRVRDAIMTALEPYQDAKSAVVNALSRIST